MARAAGQFPLLIHHRPSCLRLSRACNWAVGIGGRNASGVDKNVSACGAQNLRWSRARLRRGPVGQAGQEGEALLELLDADELVGGMRLSDVAGPADNGGRTAILEQAGLGAIGDSKRRVLTG